MTGIGAKRPIAGATCLDETELCSYFNSIRVRNFILNGAPFGYRTGTSKPADFAHEAATNLRCNWFFEPILPIFVNRGGLTSSSRELKQNMMPASPRSEVN